jgi:hypothetical protein
VAVDLHEPAAMFDWFRGIRPAFRSLGRTPGPTFTAILSLALATGGTTVYPVMFRRLSTVE